MTNTINAWFRFAGVAALAVGLSACAVDGPPAAAPAATQASLGANPAPPGGNMAGMNHGNMAGMNHGNMAGMDHSRMSPAQMRTMMAQCDGVRADARRGVALSAERQGILQHCNMMQPAAAPATGAAAPAGGAAAPAAAHRH